MREAILDTTWALVAEHGLLSMTMSQIAEEIGIGRATLYKYFPDVEAILLAWHERHVSAQLAHLRELRDHGGAAGERLEAVLHGYARICHNRERHGTKELGALLHRGEPVATAQQQLLDLFRDLIVAGAETGEVRGMSRRESWRTTACMPSPQPVPCRRRLQSADSSRSRLLRYVALADGFRQPCVRLV